MWLEAFQNRNNVILLRNLILEYIETMYNLELRSNS